MLKHIFRLFGIIMGKPFFVKRKSIHSHMIKIVACKILTKKLEPMRL